MCWQLLRMERMLGDYCVKAATELPSTKQLVMCVYVCVCLYV